jgi:hypothetical protein
MPKIAYFSNDDEGFSAAGLLGPVPESQAVSVITAITSNNKWLIIFMGSSRLLI